MVEQTISALTEEEVRLLISTSDEFAVSCLKELYKCQTTDEQSAERTKYLNNVGFNGRDSEILTSFSKQVERWDSEGEYHKFRKPLSTKQYIVLKNRLPKYSKQLANLLNR